MIKLSELDGCFYAGIGSRETPPYILVLMEEIAAKLYSQYNLILRSGGAGGADQAFQRGVEQCNRYRGMEIYIPWEGFSDLKSNDILIHALSSNEIICVQNKQILKESEEIVAKFHPYWNNLKQGARRLMARNTFQVLGSDLKTYSKFVIAWTKDGKDTGGTGQALRIANFYGIKIENLYNKKTFDKWSEWVKK